MEEKDTVLFRFVTGSYSYGTNVAGSDKDFMTVYLQEPEQRWASPKNAVKHVKYENGEEVFVEFSEFCRHVAAGHVQYVQTLFSFQENLLYYDDELFPAMKNVENFFGLLRGLVDKGKFLVALNGLVWRHWKVFQETGSTKSLSECFRCQKVGADYFDSDSFRLKLKAGSSYSNFLIDIKSGKRKVNFANVTEVLQMLPCSNLHILQGAPG